MRDFRHELRDVKCWDQHTQALLERHGEPLEDCVLQNREELIALCRFIERARVRSFVEVGAWTGALSRTLHALFAFDVIGVCDDGYPAKFGLPLRAPADAHVLRARSGSPEYLRWRAALGDIDLVFIDADHSYKGVSADFEINRALPHRFLAFHDITGANRFTRGVGRFWAERDDGHTLELVRPHVELGLDHSTMGIGIWSAEPLP